MTGTLSYILPPEERTWVLEAEPRTYVLPPKPKPIENEEEEEK